MEKQKSSRTHKVRSRARPAREAFSISCCLPLIHTSQMEARMGRGKWHFPYLGYLPLKENAFKHNTHT